MPTPQGRCLDLIWILLQVDLLRETGEDPQQELRFLRVHLPPSALGPGGRSREGLLAAAGALAARVPPGPESRGGKRARDSRSQEEARFRLYPLTSPGLALANYPPRGLSQDLPVRLGAVPASPESEFLEDGDEMAAFRAAARRHALNLCLPAEDFARLGGIEVDPLLDWLRPRASPVDGGGPGPPVYRVRDLIGALPEDQAVDSKATGTLLKGHRPSLEELVAQELGRGIEKEPPGEG